MHSPVRRNARWRPPEPMPPPGWLMRYRRRSVATAIEISPLLTVILRSRWWWEGLVPAEAELVGKRALQRLRAEGLRKAILAAGHSVTAWVVARLGVDL